MTYDEVLVYYLSGTGNSYRAATWLSNAARERGIAARAVSIETAQPGSEVGEGENHLVGLVLPVHAFTAPWAMIRFALRMPRRRVTHAFVMPTRGGVRIGAAFIPGMAGTAGYLLASILAGKGYRVRGVEGVDMPSNWMSLHPGMSRASAEAILARSRPRAVSFIGGLLAGERRLGGIVELMLGIALAPLSAGYLAWGRFFLAKLFFASDRCTGCGTCVRSCPLGAVKLWRPWGSRRARPYWTYACESCMRCMGFCPSGAVEVGHSFGALLFWATSTATFRHLLTRLTRVSPRLAAVADGRTRSILQYPYLFAAGYLTYLAFTLLLRVPAINQLFTLTTPTHYYRRYREPGTTLKDLGS